LRYNCQGKDVLIDWIPAYAGMTSISSVLSFLIIIPALYCHSHEGGNPDYHLK